MTESGCTLQFHGTNGLIFENWFLLYLKLFFYGRGAVKVSIFYSGISFKYLDLFH